MKCLPNPRLQNFSPVFSVEVLWFELLYLSLSVIHFQLIFVLGANYESKIFVYIIWITNIPALLVEKTLLFPMHCLGSFVEYHVDLLLDSILFY